MIGVTFNKTLLLHNKIIKFLLISFHPLHLLILMHLIIMYSKFKITLQLNRPIGVVSNKRSNNSNQLFKITFNKTINSKVKLNNRINNSKTLLINKGLTTNKILIKTDLTWMVNNSQTRISKCKWVVNNSNKITKWIKCNKSLNKIKWTKCSNQFKIINKIKEVILWTFMPNNPKFSHKWINKQIKAKANRIIPFWIRCLHSKHKLSNSNMLKICKEINKWWEILVEELEWIKIISEEIIRWWTKILEILLQLIQLTNNIIMVLIIITMVIILVCDDYNYKIYVYFLTVLNSNT